MIQAKADFSRPADYPLVKTKFDVYNCTYVSYEHWMRDLYLTRELNIDGLRYDPGWGWGEKEQFNRPYEFGGEQIGGTPDQPAYRWEKFDAAAAELEAHRLKTMYVCAYTPRMLQDERGSWQGKPKDLAAFARICRDFADHWRKTRRAHYYEVWNEPDLTDVFFHDTLEDYLDIYHHVSRALREGDPDALVGGPSLAYKDEWMPAFLDYVKQHRLPLDYISYHHYGDIRAKVGHMRQHLVGEPAFATVQTLITEFHSIRNGQPGFSMGGKIETYEGARLLLRDFKWFLEQPDVNKVYWAQYSDPEVYNDKYVDRCGLITTDGHRKALFNAFKIYGEMPVERYAFASSNEAIDGMASSDGRKASVVLWNNSGEEQETEAVLSGLPFARGRFRVYRIDHRHSSYLDNSDSERLEQVEGGDAEIEASWHWTGTLPPYGVVYLTIEDSRLRDPGDLDTVAVTSAGREIQTLYAYPDRTKRNYAEFDRKTWTAYLGMAAHDEAFSIVGVVAEELAEELAISCELDASAKRAGDDSLLGVRIDYAAAGEYTASVLICDERFGSSDGGYRPWGTGRQPDEIVRANLSSYSLNPARYAPEGWQGGRCIVTFLMRNAGSGARAKFQVEPATAHAAERSDALPPAVSSASAAEFPTRMPDSFSISFLLKCGIRGSSGGWEAGYPLLTAATAASGKALGVAVSANRLAFGVGPHTVLSSTPVNDGKWRHVTVTRDAASGRLAIYVNGRLNAMEQGAAGRLPDPGILRWFRGDEAAAGEAAADLQMQRLNVHPQALLPLQIEEISGRRYELGRFAFGEAGGDRLIDASPYGWNGKLYGEVLRVTGERGPALRFDGRGGYATIPRKVSDDFTILCWIRTTDSGGEGQWFDGKGIVDGSVEGALNDFGLSLVGGKLAFGAGNPVTTIVSRQEINDGAWHHIAATRRRSDGAMTVYVDGEISVAGVGGRTSLFSSYELSIGRIHKGANPWNGEISDLRLHATALSAERIRAIYRNEWAAE